MRTFLLSTVLAAALAGCSSTPDPAPVATGAAPVATAPAATPQSAVAPVTASPVAPSLAGPAGAARIVYFEFDSSAIRPEFQPHLEAHARFLRANPTRRVVIEGHTDERGGREYNLALGNQRAEAVGRTLSLLGAGKGQIEAVSFGEERPAAAGSNEDAWARNRRAEINYRP